MNALLTAASLLLGICVALLVPDYGPAAILLCLVASLVAGYVILRNKEDGKFLLQIFTAGLLVRMLVGTGIFYMNAQEFFGGDAFTYDFLGDIVARGWQSGTFENLESHESGWGMIYMVASVYTLVGRNMLAVQFINAVLGAATAPIIFLCAKHIFHNSRVASSTALLITFYPSLVLWSSQGLKDGPMVFLLALAILATLKLGERLSVKYVIVLGFALLGILSLRFYVFYMIVVAVGGALIIGMKRLTTQGLVSQFIVIIVVGVALLYLGVLRTIPRQLEMYGNLEALQTSRADLANSAKTGFGKDVDVSTTSGAISTIPVGLLYLLFAPFPWQLASLRQSITLPEMLLWWASFPLLVMGLWFTLKYRLRQALPILVFTSMLTLAYSVFQGNVGTAYRQRSQLLVFFFMFVAVGYVLLREKQEDIKQRAIISKRRTQLQAASAAARRKQQREWEAIANRISEKIGF
ncbi:MAG TPA: glycosyltransferase family 39 protein [Pyrinomonadaceae bacterium]|jgi:4-amino-4-deoxy-L-arabinose transferase-like glycosyltransferase